MKGGPFDARFYLYCDWNRWPRVPGLLLRAEKVAPPPCRRLDCLRQPHAGAPGAAAVAFLAENRQARIWLAEAFNEETTSRSPLWRPLPQFQASERHRAGASGGFPPN